MLELKDITKTYYMGTNEVRVLRGVSFSIEDGDYVAIMGPSGSGKSTLMHILGLLDVPSTGSYRVDDREVSRLSDDELAILRREAMGFVFQQFNLLSRMSATENVSLPLIYSRGALNFSWAKELLARVGLGDRAEHRPNELSGGQQQRVAIARSLVNRPRMILADEPTGNLDSNSEKEILRILRELNDQGITVVVVTHEEEIGRQAKRLIRVRDGLIQSDERLAPKNSSLASKNPTEESQPKSKWGDIIQHLRQGFRTLAANKIRTALSMLGILIGVAAVVAMLAVGRGAQKDIEARLASLGSNLLVLRPGAIRAAGVAQESGTTSRLTLDDVQAIRDKVGLVRRLAASVNGKAQITYGNKNWSTSIQGTEFAFTDIRASKPEVGRFFSDDENKKRSRVAVLGLTVVKELFGDSNPIGEMIKINKVNFQVIGILPEKGSGGGWRDQDDIIIVPLITAMHRLLGKDYIDSIDLEISDAKRMDEAQDKVLDLMYTRHRVALSQRQGAFDIRNMADIQAALSDTSNTMALLLASIAVISLLVGGIGIMNIMLVSVTERTKEIGLRKAVGAKRKDILAQFLSEAVVVSTIGGVVGIILGWVIAQSISIFAGWTTSVSVGSVVLAFVFSGSVGIIFGIYPARKASLLHPIDALRHE